MVFGYVSGQTYSLACMKAVDQALKRGKELKDVLREAERNEVAVVVSNMDVEPRSR